MALPKVPAVEASLSRGVPREERGTDEDGNKVHQGPITGPFQTRAVLKRGLRSAFMQDTLAMFSVDMMKALPKKAFFPKERVTGQLRSR